MHMLYETAVDWGVSMVKEKVIATVSYNKLDREGWIENRDYSMKKSGSSFVNLKELEKSGQKVREKKMPRKFVDIGKIDY